MDVILLVFDNATTVIREDIVVCVATESKLTLSISVIWFYCYTKASSPY